MNQREAIHLEQQLQIQKSSQKNRFEVDRHLLKSLMFLIIDGLTRATEAKRSDSLFLTTLMAWFRIAADAGDTGQLGNGGPPPPPPPPDVVDVTDDDGKAAGLADDGKAAGFDIRENRKLDVRQPTEND